MRIELHIGRLVLDGLPSALTRSDQLVAALEASLRDELRTVSPDRLDPTAETVRRTSVALPHEPRPDVAGTTLGAAIASTLRRSDR